MLIDLLIVMAVVSILAVMVKTAVRGLGVFVRIDGDWQGLIVQPLAVSTSIFRQFLPEWWCGD